MNRADLDALLGALVDRLANESDQLARDLRDQAASARARLADTCESSEVLEQLALAARNGLPMGRTDHPAVMRLWVRADAALALPCTPVRPRAADCVFRAIVVNRAQHWINGAVSFQPEAADVIEVWRPRVDDKPAVIRTLSERVLDVSYALSDLRNVYPTDEERKAAGHPPVEDQLPRLALITRELEELETALRAAGL